MTVCFHRSHQWLFKQLKIPFFAIVFFFWQKINKKYELLKMYLSCLVFVEGLVKLEYIGYNISFGEK